MARRRILLAAAATAVGLAALPGCGTGPPARSTAWVATYATSAQPGDTIVPIDLATHRVLTPVKTAGQPSAMAFADGGKRLLVTNEGNDTVSVVDPSSGDVTGTVEVGLEPDAVAVTPGGSGTALVANFGDGTVTPIDLATLRTGTPIPVGVHPDAVAVVPAGGGRPPTAIVANYGSGSVTPIDLATMSAGPAIAVGSQPDAIGVIDHAPGVGGGPVALVCDFGTTEVITIDVDTGTVGAPIALTGNPTGVAVAPDGTAWVTSGDTLTSVSGSTLSAGPPIALPYVGEAVAVEGASTAWVAEEDGSVVPVTLPSGPVGRGLHVGDRPTALVVPPAG
jgi:YVTN family beta-propeller protein